MPDEVIDGIRVRARWGRLDSAGARVLQEAELMSSLGPVLGKGDAMWRALSVLDCELVCFLVDPERTT